MTARNPQANAKTTAAALIREGREAGWQRVRCEIMPDGSVRYEAGMAEPDGGDDFLSNDLRMGK